MKKLLTIEKFFILVIFCLPLYLIRFTVFNVPTNVFEILLITATLKIFIKKRSDVLRSFSILPKNLLLACAFIIFGLVVSIISNDNFYAGLGILKSWFLIPLISSFAIYLFLDSTEFLEKIYRSLFYSAAAVSAIALGYKILGLVTYDNRLSAFYLSPNYLAMYLAPGIFFGAFFLQKSFPENFRSLKSFFDLILFFIIAIALYFTFSYGAWLAVIGSVSISMFVLISNKRLLLSALLLLLAFTGILFFSQAGTQKFSSSLKLSSRSSSASRIMIWKSSILMLEKNPFVGIGPGNFQQFYLEYQKYFPPYLEWAVPEPHNLFLAFWLQAGFVGLIGFLILLFYIFRILFELLKNKKSALLAAPLFGFFLYTCLHGLTDTPFWKNDLAFLFWLCVFSAAFLKKLFPSYNNIN